MRVPTWDCPDLGMMEGPLDTTTVVSEDIWKKFDLDFPDSFTPEQYYAGVIEDGVLPEQYDRTGSYEKCSSSPPASLSLSLSLSLSSSLSRLEAREIRHHDCMWAGLCISKEHNRTLPAKKDIHQPLNGKKIVQAGRSLLINRKQLLPSSCTSITKNLESDGDSTRPETPQSSESETESENEAPRFKHDSISINEKLSEYLGDAAAPVSEVTGQLVRRVTQNGITDKKFARRGGGGGFVKENSRTSLNGRNLMNGGKEDTVIGNRVEKNNDDHSLSSHCKNSSSNTTRGNKNQHHSPGIQRGSIVSLGDHCYHLNQTSSSKKTDYLGIQTPSDSEEEIDVVTFDKPCRPASLPTNPSAADKQHLQNTVTSALKDNKSTSSRPRGRPPSNPGRKRSAQTDPKPAKRQKHKTYQKRGRIGDTTTNGSSGQGSRRSPGSDKGLIESVLGSSGRSHESNNNNSDNNNNINNRFVDSSRIDPVPAARGSTDRSESGRLFQQQQQQEENHGMKSSSSPSSSSSGVTISRSSSDDEPDTEKRSLHNNMERQRRIELRNAFEELRVLVPEVEMKEKAPKVVILRQAAVYCDMLTEIGHATLSKVTELKRRQDRLRTRLSQLRRNFAATR